MLLELFGGAHCNNILWRLCQTHCDLPLTVPPFSGLSICPSTCFGYGLTEVFAVTSISAQTQAKSIADSARNQPKKVDSEMAFAPTLFKEISWKSHAYSTRLWNSLTVCLLAAGEAKRVTTCSKSQSLHNLEGRGSWRYWHCNCMCYGPCPACMYRSEQWSILGLV